MNVLLFLLLGTGPYLIWCGITGRSPTDTARLVLQGKPLPALNSWLPLPGVRAIVLGSASGQFNEAGTWVPGQGYVPGGSGGGFGSIIDNVNSVGALGKRLAVVQYAQQQLGEPYVFGASGPNSWDCSGLTMRAYQAVGISLPHNAAMQQLKGTRVTSPQAGDLCFWGVASGHVGIYIGNGQILHAPQSGDVVKVSPVWDVGSINYRSYL